MSKKVDVKVRLEIENYQKVKSFCEENGVSMAEFQRYACKLAMEDKDLAPLTHQPEKRAERIDRIHREGKAEEKTANFRDRAWHHMIHHLNREVPPEPDDFWQTLEAYQKEAQEHPGKEKEFKTYVTWVNAIYEVCHPEGGPDKGILRSIFYLVENGSVKGKTALVRVAWDTIQKHTNVPDQYLVDAWRQGSRMARQDEWKGEWRDSVGPLLDRVEVG